MQLIYAALTDNQNPASEGQTRVTYHQKIAEKHPCDGELGLLWAFGTVGRHTVDLEEEGYFGGGVESERSNDVSNLELKL